ncbi:MAG TPA: hypothetical protein O0X42_02530 [Methanocorpusculum sp.]|nr:hypothetical protein [Methanocorpusculum sp.]HJJ38991.1 hypothetical protein [Methanocorpusculum sp.]
MGFKRKYTRFKVSSRFSRRLEKLIAGCAEVREMQNAGQIITAEKKYNKKLCFYYGECRFLLKRRAEELEGSENAVLEMEKIRAAFLEFYALAEGYKVDIAEQKKDALAFIDKAEEVLRNK